MKSNQVTGILIILLVALAAGCSTSEKATEPDTDTAELAPLDESKSEDELQQILSSTRSSLSDVYLTQSHDMPEPFLEKDTTDNVQRDPFDGYRIQIISTRNVDLADSISTQFQIWADTTIVGYSPKSYVFFKQPFYKVHVGDFQDRNRANEVSKLVKRKYSEAWVVHDKIDPNRVPADTTQIGLAENDKRSENSEQ